MATRPAYVYNGSGWDDIGDKRIGAEAGDIPQASVEDLTSDLASKLDLAGGKILQIVRATDSTTRSTTSVSYVDTGHSITITPQKSDSAIIVIANYFVDASAAADRGQIVITDNSNNVLSGSERGQLTADAYASTMTFIGYSTPATTSATTYKTRFLVQLSGTLGIANSLNTGQLYAIEVST